MPQKVVSGSKTKTHWYNNSNFVSMECKTLFGKCKKVVYLWLSVLDTCLYDFWAVLLLCQSGGCRWGRERWGRGGGWSDHMDSIWRFRRWGSAWRRYLWGAPLASKERGVVKVGNGSAHTDDVSICQHAAGFRLRSVGRDVMVVVAWWRHIARSTHLNIGRGWWRREGIARRSSTRHCDDGWRHGWRHTGSRRGFWWNLEGNVKRGVKQRTCTIDRREKDWGTLNKEMTNWLLRRNPLTGQKYFNIVYSFSVYCTLVSRYNTR